MKPFDEALSNVPTSQQIHDVAECALSKPAEAHEAMLRGYFAFSNVLGRLLHGDNGIPENATFPTFAAWAAETLHPEVVRRVESAKRPFGFPRPLRSIYRQAAGLVLGDDEVIARNLAQGEAVIYEEICLAIRAVLEPTLRRLSTCDQDDDDQDNNQDDNNQDDDQDDDYASLDWDDLWKACTKELVEISNEVNTRRERSGHAEAIGAGDVAVLQRAMRPYFDVLQEQLSHWNTGLDAFRRKRRAELILLGNIRLEAYVQTRIQPVFERNLAYVPDAIRAMLGNRLLARSRLTARLARGVYEASGTTAEIFDEAFEIAATRYVYFVVIGNEELGLGRDLPLPPPANPVLRDSQPEPDRQRYGAGNFFPYDLQTVADRNTWSAWQRYDRSAGQGTRTAVDNWLRYEERLNYLANLFRSRQQLTALYDQPRSLRQAVPPPAGSLGSVAADLSDATLDRLARVMGGR
jgi:hypothetical protein